MLTSVSSILTWSVHYHHLKDYTYLLTCMDQFTRWPEAIPLSDITAESVAKAFISGWISRFGIPPNIITDRGKQFESQLWNSLTKLLGMKSSEQVPTTLNAMAWLNGTVPSPPQISSQDSTNT